MLTDQQRRQYLDIASETISDYIDSLVQYKADNNILSWQDIANLVEEKYGVLHSRHWYSRYYDDYITSYQGYQPQEVDDIEVDPYQEKLLNLQKEKVKISDERNQNRAYVRRLAREETLKEIALEAAKAIGAKKLLPSYKDVIKFPNSEKEGIVLISDWHYGIEINNAWNIYNPQITRERVAKLRDKVIEYGRQAKLSRLHVLNLADLIAGRIHLTIRLESRIDVITQIMEVSEILAEFLIDLSQYFDIDYYSCTDNHSRVEPDKTQSLDLESLCRITDWYLNMRVGQDINIHDNKFGQDIITLNILGHNVLGVHGDRDKQNSVIEKMTLFTRQSYDLICTAHLHHFSADEHTGALLISNSSLMGTDSYATKLRLHARPSQTLIIVSKDNVAEDIKRIILD